MFGKRSSNPPVSSSSSVDTLIGPNTEATGDINFRGGMRIEGVVRGNVKATGDNDAVLVLATAARVEGTVEAPTVVVNGSIHGDLHAHKRADLKATARIEGDVHYASLGMEQGAVINGNLYCEGKPATGATGLMSSGTPSK